MRNKEVIRRFVEGCENGVGKDLYIHGCGIFSYEMQFPIGANFEDEFVLNKEVFPYPTTEHQLLLEQQMDKKQVKERVSSKRLQEYLLAAEWLKRYDSYPSLSEIKQYLEEGMR